MIGALKILLASVALLAACSGSEPSTVEAIEAGNSAEGAMLRAIKASDPTLYAQVAETTGAALAAGKPSLRAVAAARANYYPAFIRRLRWAQDDDALAERTASIARLEYLLAQDPIACALASAGDSGAASGAIPEEMLRSEMTRIARAMALDTSVEPPPALSQEEMSAIINRWIDDNPSQHPALRMLVRFRDSGRDPASITRDDAISVCSANIATMKNVSALPPEKQAQYQRALVGMY